MCIEKHAAKAQESFSSESPGAPVKMCGASGDPSYTLDEVPPQLVADAAGVYGYLPKPGTPFAKSPPWPDWTDPVAVAQARATRLLYHEGFAQEVKLAQDLRAAGEPAETIARQLSELRNVNRMAMYPKDQLPMLFERNLVEYGRKEGPSFEFLMDKYGNDPEKIIASGMRTNPGMDVLCGVAKVVQPK
jgi:hypothetical protein